MLEHVTKIDGNAMRCVIFDDQKETREKVRPAVDRGHWITSWVGITKTEAFKKFESGDNEMVAPSDKMLAKLEDKIDFPTSRYKVFDAVAGGVPNIPALLANQPLNMRVRRRSVDDLAPLTICIDLTSSADIDQEYLIKRGSAILALARILTTVRPVNIWLGAGLSDGKNVRGSTAWFRLDASPLDLGRAAFQISSAGVGRGMLYNFLQQDFGCGGGWPLHNCDTWRAVAPKFLAQWFDGEIMFVPPVFYQDKDFKTPDKWLADMLVKYGGRPE